MSTLTIYIIAGVAFGGSWLVKRWLKTTYNKWSQVPNTHGVTGAETAAAILAHNGVTNVRIEPVKGRLTDHYDPDRDILRLSTTNYGATSVAAMAVSAHEAGHAMQDARGDLRLRFRRFLVPAAAMGQRFGPIILMVGLVSQSTMIMQIGVLLLAGTMLFQIATLPVEINASRRALKNLRALGLDDPEQEKGTKRVLTAAAFTYIAAAATSLAYFAAMFAGGGRRRSI
ncbi:MAG: zinc metallopeptidase [Acidimicrobiales bacterium]